jgi:hypothetical protein
MHFWPTWYIIIGSRRAVVGARHGRGPARPASSRLAPAALMLPPPMMAPTAPLAPHCAHRAPAAAHKGLRRASHLARHICGGAPPGGGQLPPPPPPAAAAAFTDADRARRGFVEPRISSAEVSAFEDNGFMVLPKVLTDRGLAALRDEAQHHWTAVKGHTDVSLGTWLQAGLLVNIHHYSQLIRDFYWCGPVAAAARQLIGPNVKACTAQLTFKMPGMTKEVDWCVSSQSRTQRRWAGRGGCDPWARGDVFGRHQDNQYGHLSPYTTLSECLSQVLCVVQALTL